MIIICAWCKKLKRAVVGYPWGVSHGMCGECFDKEIKALARYAEVLLDALKIEIQVKVNGEVFGTKSFENILDARDHMEEFFEDLEDDAERPDGDCPCNLGDDVTRITKPTTAQGDHVGRQHLHDLSSP